MLYSHIHPSYLLILNISLPYFHIHPTYFFLPKYIPDIFPNPSFLLPTSFFLNVSVLYFPIYPSYFLIPKNIHAILFYQFILLVILPKYIPAVFPYPSFLLPSSKIYPCCTPLSILPTSYFLNISLLYSPIHPSYFLLPKYIPAIFPYPSFLLPSS